jgi:hypothetical protein
LSLPTPLSTDWRSGEYRNGTNARPLCEQILVLAPE